jgi:fibronectin type 3 domain-containing protein
MTELNLRTVLLLFLGAICSTLFAACSPDTPNAPTGLSAESQDGAVSLNWNTVEGGDVKGYNVYRSTNQFGETSQASKINESLVKDPSFTDDEATNGTTYHYRTASVAKASGFLGFVGGGTKKSNPSDEVKETPFSDPPDRP